MADSRPLHIELRARLLTMTFHFMQMWHMKPDDSKIVEETLSLFIDQTLSKLSDIEIAGKSTVIVNHYKVLLTGVTKYYTEPKPFSSTPDEPRFNAALTKALRDICPLWPFC